MSDLWATPQRLFDRLNAEFGFTLDVCALPGNAKCERYFTPDVDGLAQPWEGVVWMNPPYGRPIWDWLCKAHGEALHCTVVALVPTRTNAPWWHDFAMRADEIRFIRKKVAFDGPKRGVAFTGHAILVFRAGLGRRTPTVSSWEQR